MYVLGSFRMRLYMFGHVRTRSDTFGCVRMRSDAIGRARTFSELFGNYRIFLSFFESFRMFSEALATSCGGSRHFTRRLLAVHLEALVTSRGACGARRPGSEFFRFVSFRFDLFFFRIFAIFYLRNNLLRSSIKTADLR